MIIAAVHTRWGFRADRGEWDVSRSKWEWEWHSCIQCFLVFCIRVRMSLLLANFFGSFASSQMHCAALFVALRDKLCPFWTMMLIPLYSILFNNSAARVELLVAIPSLPALSPLCLPSPFILSFCTFLLYILAKLFLQWWRVHTMPWHTLEN